MKMCNNYSEHYQVVDPHAVKVVGCCGLCGLECYCYGYESKCDFYPEKREKDELAKKENDADILFKRIDKQIKDIEETLKKIDSIMYELKDLLKRWEPYGRDL